MKRYKRLFAMLLAVLTVLSLAACGKRDTLAPKDDVVTQPSLDVDAEVPKDTEPVYDESFVFGSAAWYMFSEYGNSLLYGNVFESLIKPKDGNPDEYEGMLAESWYVSEDGLEWRFKIKDGVYFSNGTLCDAEAAAQSIAYWIENHVLLSENKPTQICAEEGNILLLKFKTPFDDLEYNLANEYSIIVEKNSLEESSDSMTCFIGTGPYVIESYSSNGERTLKLSENYRGESAKIETIVLRGFETEQEMAEALINGELDSAVFSDYALFDSIVDSSPEEAKTEYCDAKPVILNAAIIEQVSIPEVRKAISMLIDLERLNEEAYYGYGRVEKSIWAEGCCVYVEAEPRVYDPQGALELLSSVGIAPEDIAFTQHVFGNEDEWRRLESIGRQLAEAGICVEYEYYERYAPSTPIMTGEWAMYTFNNTVSGCRSIQNLFSYFIPDNSLITIHLDLYGEDIQSAVMAEYELIENASDWDELIEHVKELTRILQDEYIIHPTVQGAKLVVRSGEYDNYEFKRVGTESYALEFAKLKRK